ncbi:DUF1996 domain-containing protein [Aquihabitans sp. G128]|uniref:DUF1996 domain-containing protein n=1 Tax=Aquihabitans sp. G128 TaxID=2849779 RepID=UPI001C23686B|nr:DUF1996 domain-containing protein [Aquihabitans sp. G128]QXC63008.1 DUF1996 domain-containing protein [Aquihabitans sp. G128]
MRLAPWVALAGLVLGVAACGDGRPVGEAGGEPGAVRRGPHIAATIDSALFTVDCTLSHSAPDDPIVYPDQPGRSHLHDFFGAEGTDAASTAANLRGGPTSCEDQEDTASYWVPALFDGPTKVRPTFVRAYYRAAPGADVTEVQALPPGLEMIQGDMHRMAGDWPDVDQVGWGCGLRPKRLHHVPPGNCTVASPVTLRLVFPDCWDGEHVASADHRSHLARSTRGRCPASHPVPILQVQLSVQYPVWEPTSVAASPRAGDLTLASGGWEGSHGDVLNAWDPARLEHQTDLCIRAMANCTIG